MFPTEGKVFSGSVILFGSQTGLRVNVGKGMVMVMKHSNNVRGASFAALAAALSFVLIYLGQALALFDMSAVVICGLVTACLSYVFGIKIAFSEALVTTALLAFFLPDKTAAVLYFTAGGLYPVLKPCIERCRLRLVLKLIAALVTVGIYIGACMLFLPDEFGGLLLVGGAALGVLCFMLYDILITRLLMRYGLKIMKLLNK